jgi:hypothetical protein
MGTVPHDVLVEILEWLIGPEQHEITTFFEAQWPFEVLYDVPLRSSRAQTHLQMCSLVCRWWRAVAQPILQEHLCWSSLKGKAVVEDLLKIDRVAIKVASIEVGQLYCNKCSLGEPCSCGISIEIVVSTLAMCPRLTRLTINTWDVIDVTPSIPPSPIKTFPQLTTFRIGCSVHSHRIPLRAFCLVLQLMPALHTLSIGDIRNTSSDETSDIPHPPCQLRSFIVADARGIDFQSYDWLLHNSQHSLQMLHTYCILPGAVASLLRALRHLGPSLREFRCMGCWNSQVPLSALQLCHKLEAFVSCSSPDVLDELTLPQLREWKLQTWAKERLVDVSVNELIALKNECDIQGVVFDFARYNEVTEGHKQ